MVSKTSEKGPLIGQRHVLSLIAACGLGILFASRSSLSVALVAMVATTNLSNSDINTDSDCSMANWNGSHVHKRGEFDWPRELQGIILSCYFWGYLVLQVPAGSLAQRYGAKWLLAGGLTWMSILNVLIPISARTSPYLMITILVLMGVGSSVTFPSVVAMMGRWAPPHESTRLTTLAMSGSYFGTIIGQLYSGPVCDSELLGGWPTVFYINGGLGMLWVILWILLAFNSPDEHPRITTEERNYIKQTVGSDQRAANRSGVPFCKILFSIEMLVYIPLSFALGWISYTILTCLPQFMSDVLHVNISSNSVLVSLPIIAELIVSNSLTHVADAMIIRQYFSKLVIRKIFTVMGFWGCGLAFVAVNFVGCDSFAIEVVLVIGYALFGAIYSGYFLLPLDVSPEFSGTIFGIGNLFTTSAGIAAPIFTGAITAGKSRQDWSIVFIVSGSIAASAGLLYLILGRVNRRKWRKSEERKPLLTESKANSKNDMVIL